MSRPNKRMRSGSSAPSGRSGGNAPRRKSTTPGVVRQPVGQAPATSRIDSILPPFSTKRYVAIWLPVMLLFVAVLLVLTQCNGGNASPGAQATSTPTALAFGNTGETASQSPGATEMPTAGGAAGSTPTAPGAGGAESPAGGASLPQGKFFIIETAKGRIVAKLHTDASAKVGNTIANFEQKANAGEFNGRTFHRVEDWVIQGGDPLGNGTGGGDMPSEYNDLPFKTGALGIARGPDPAINNDSQFFIVKTDSDFLNGQYTNWGQVVEGMDVVNQIAVGDRIEKITVENR